MAGAVAGMGARGLVLASPAMPSWSSRAELVAAAVTAQGQGGGSAAGERYSAGLAASSVGQLLSRNGACTATVITSDSGRVAVTAGHCVYIPEHHDAFQGGLDALTPGWAQDVSFYPGRIEDRAPYGEWAIERAWVDRRWYDSGDPRYDLAFLTVANLDGRTVQAVAGAEGAQFDTFDPDSSSGTGSGSGKPDTAALALTALGYPVAAPFDGTTLRRCTTPAAQTEVPGFYGMACQMTGGASGGPWLRDFDPAQGSGSVVAVTTLSPLDHPELVYSVRLGAFAQRLFEAADNPSTATT